MGQGERDQPFGRSTRHGVTYLGGVLEDVGPLLLGHSGCPFEGIEVGDLGPVFGRREDENKEIGELLGLRGPLPLNNACARPAGLEQRMSHRRLDTRSDQMNGVPFPDNERRASLLW